MAAHLACFLTLHCVDFFGILVLTHCHYLTLSQQYGPGNPALLSNACRVIDVLDHSVKKDLLSWFVKLQLSEYLVLFSDNQDVRFHIFYTVFALKFRFSHAVQYSTVLYVLYVLYCTVQYSTVLYCCFSFQFQPFTHLF